MDFPQTEFVSKNKKNPKREGQLTLDVYQSNRQIIIKSAIGGIAPSDIDISVTTDTVTIRGERKRDAKIKQSDFYYQELYWGNFSRTVILPADVDQDRAKASMKNGILTISLPLLKEAK